MGGIGSGNWYRWDKRDAVEDCRSLDVRRWEREGYLVPGHCFGWQWTRDGETVASIQVRMQADWVTLSYRRRSGGGECKRLFAEHEEAAAESLAGMAERFKVGPALKRPNDPRPSAPSTEDRRRFHAHARRGRYQIAKVPSPTPTVARPRWRHAQTRAGAVPSPLVAACANLESAIAATTHGHSQGSRDHGRGARLRRPARGLRGGAYDHRS